MRSAWRSSSSGGTSSPKPWRGRVVGDRDVLVAALARRLGHLLDRGVAVGGGGVHVQVAADVAQLDQLRQLALAGCGQLAAVLAQLGRDPLHAEPLVDLLLGRAGDRLPALVVGDAVLAHVQAALDRRRAQRLVVAPRAREVLEQVAERLLRHDAQVDREPDVRQRAGARLAGGGDRVDRGRRAERLHQRGRVAGGGDDVEILDVVGPAAGAAGQLDGDHGRVLAQRGDQLVADLERLGQHHAHLGVAVRAGCQRGDDVLLGLLAEAGDVGQPALLGRLAQLVERRHAEVLVEQPGPLRPEPWDPGDLDQAGGDARLELVCRGDRAGLEQGVDLLGDRLAHARELLDAPFARHLLDRHPGLADGLGGGAVGADAIDDRPVQLIEAGQLLEGLRDLAVSHRARVRALCRTPG